MAFENLQTREQPTPGTVLVAMAQQADREELYVRLADEGFAVEPMGSATGLLRQLMTGGQQDGAAVAILLDEDLVREADKRSALLGAIEAHQGTLERVIPMVKPGSRRERWFTATGATQPTQPRSEHAGELLSAVLRIASVPASSSPAPAPDPTEPWLSIRAASMQEEWDATLYRSQLASFCERNELVTERIADRIGDATEEELAGELAQLESGARSVGALPLAALAEELARRLRIGGPVALSGRLSELARTMDATLGAVQRRRRSTDRPIQWAARVPVEAAPLYVSTAA